MTRVKSFGFNSRKKGSVNPYEYIKFTVKSVNHRTHRTKRMKGGYGRRKLRIAYKQRLEELKLKELES
ncbi:MAG: hypothetical protein AABY22_34015 [Nanoarchaeota archaeon]